MRGLLVLALAGCAAARPVPPRAATLGSVPVRAGDGWVSLSEMARGRPLVIELFATWCEPCREQIVEIDALARRPPGDLLVVAVDIAEERATVERFVRRHGLSLPVFLDPQLHFQDSLGSDTVPQILVIDRQGRIVHRGAALDAATRAAIDAEARPKSTAFGR